MENKTAISTSENNTHDEIKKEEQWLTHKPPHTHSHKLWLTIPVKQLPPVKKVTKKGKKKGKEMKGTKIQLTWPKAEVFASTAQKGTRNEKDEILENKTVTDENSIL